MKNNTIKLVIGGIILSLLVCVLCIGIAYLYLRNETIPENKADYLKYFSETIAEENIDIPYYFDLECEEGQSRFVIVTLEENSKKSHSIFLKTDKETKLVGTLGDHLGVGWVKILPILLSSGHERKLFYLAHVDESLGIFSSNDGIVPNLGLSSPDANGPYWDSYKIEGSLWKNYSIIPTKDARFYDIASIQLQTKESLNYGFENSGIDSNEDDWYSKIEKFDPSIDLVEYMIEIEVPNCRLP